MLTVEGIKSRELINQRDGGHDLLPEREEICDIIYLLFTN
jgi:hypothetical protein